MFFRVSNPALGADVEGRLTDGSGVDSCSASGFCAPAASLIVFSGASFDESGRVSAGELGTTSN